MPPEDDPRDETQTYPCRECDGNGWVYDKEDGGTKTCPRCDGECSDPDPTQQIEE